MGEVRSMHELLEDADDGEGRVVLHREAEVGDDVGMGQFLHRRQLLQKCLSLLNFNLLFVEIAF